MNKDINKSKEFRNWVQKKKPDADTWTINIMYSAWCACCKEFRDN